MASNFDFLPEDPSWCKDVRRAERRIYSDPASACAKARRALEFVVGEVYERELDVEEQGNLFVDVDARALKRWVRRQDTGLYDAFHQIRQSGNDGAHHQKEGDVGPEEALTTVRSLNQVVWWYVQRYAPAHAVNGTPSFDPPSPETSHSDDADIHSEPQDREGVSRKPARQRQLRSLTDASIRQLTQVIKNEPPGTREVEVATATLLNRIRDVNDELIATL